MPRIVLDAFPMVLTVSPKRYDEASVKAMLDGYEKLFERKERYALLTVVPKGAEMPGAGMRKMITDWANEPRVRALTAKLNVGSATVIANPLARGVLTAMYWVWEPPSPQHLVATGEEGLAWALARLAEAGVAMPLPPAAVRDRLLPIIRSM